MKNTPWQVDDNDGIAVIDCDRNLIANLYLEENENRCQHDLPNAKENARLIAASPEMFDRLNDILILLNQGTPIYPGGYIFPEEKSVESVLSKLIEKIKRE